MEALERQHTSDRRARKKQQTRRRLLEVALAAFAERGYEATTMDQIADDADVARSTLFNYFPRKEEVLAALIQDRRAATAETIRNHRRTDAGTATTLRDVLGDLAAWYEAAPAERSAFVRCTIQAGAALDPAWFDSALVLAGVIRAGQERGEVAAEVNADLAGRLLLDGYVGVMQRWAIAGGRGPLMDELAEMLDLFLAGLLTTPVP